MGIRWFKPWNQLISNWKWVLVAILGCQARGKQPFLTFVGAFATSFKSMVSLAWERYLPAQGKKWAALRFNISLAFSFLQASNLIPFLKIEDQFQLIWPLLSKNGKKLISWLRPIGVTRSKRNTRQYPVKSSLRGERQRSCYVRKALQERDIILARWADS